MAARLAEGHSASMVSSKGMQECRAFSRQPALQLEEYADESLCWALSKLQYWAKPISHLTSGSPYCTLENYSQNDRGNMEISSIQFTAFPRILPQTNQSCLSLGKVLKEKDPWPDMKREWAAVLSWFGPLSHQTKTCYIWKKQQEEPGGRWPWEHEKKLVCFLFSLFGLIE